MLALMFIPKSGSQTTVQYDPWADINDDGKIDIKDIAYSSRLFGTLGDPTKNVNITHWEPAYKVLHFVANLTWGPNYLGDKWVPDFFYPVFVGGYSRMFVYMKPKYPYGTVGTYKVTHSLIGCGWYSSVYETGMGEAYRGEKLSTSASNITVEVKPGPSWGYFFPTIDENARIEIKAPYVTLGFYSNSTISSGWMLMDIYVYLRNE
jgi:hypothetical protein